MWSTVTEAYPMYFSPSQAPQGSVRVVEPQVIREYDYRFIRSPMAPYELTSQQYSKRLWIC